MALDFRGNTADVVSRAASPLNVNSTYTVAGWMKIDSLASERIFVEVGVQFDNDRDRILATSSNWQISCQAGTATGGTPATGTWYHVAFVRESGTSAKLYINGALTVTSTTNVGTTRGTTENMYFGRASWGWGALDGQLAFIKAWTDALTIDEVAQEMNSIAPRRWTNLTHWYPTWYASGERTKDYSGAGRNLTETGTITDIDPPPVSWGAGVLVNPLTPASSDQSLTPTGLTSTVAFGAPTVGATYSLTPSGMASTVAFGAATVSHGLTATGVASAVAFGAPTVEGGTATLAPTGLDSTVAFGSPTVSGGEVTLQPSGLASTVAFGAPTASATYGLTATGVASGAAFGAPAATTSNELAAAGMSSAVTFGAATVTPGAVGLTATGLDSTVAFGSPTAASVYEVLATAIGSAVAFGTPTITPGAVDLSAVGLASTVLFGVPFVSVGALRGHLVVGDTARGGATASDTPRGGVATGSSRRGGLTVADN